MAYSDLRMDAAIYKRQSCVQQHTFASVTASHNPDINSTARFPFCHQRQCYLLPARTCICALSHLRLRIKYRSRSGVKGCALRPSFSMVLVSAYRICARAFAFGALRARLRASRALCSLRHVVNLLLASQEGARVWTLRGHLRSARK
jgi:hypothetical protein